MISSLSITFTIFQSLFCCLNLLRRNTMYTVFPSFLTMVVNSTPKFHVSMHMYATSNRRRIDGVVYMWSRIPVFCCSNCYLLFKWFNFDVKFEIISSNYIFSFQINVSWCFHPLSVFFASLVKKFHCENLNVTHFYPIQNCVLLISLL